VQQRLRRNRAIFVNAPDNAMQHHTHHLDHLLNKSVDILLSVTKITTLNEVLELSSSEATSRVRQLEGPEKVAGLLEIGTNSHDLVDQVFHADNTVLAKIVLDQLIVGESNSLLVDLSISSLVDKLSDGFEVGVAIGNVWIDDCQHLLSGFGQSDEDTVVDLKESEELEDLSRLGSHLVDTLDSDNEDKLGLLLNVERTILPAQSRKSNLLTLCITVLLDVLLSSFEDDSSFLLVGLLSLLDSSISLFSGLLLALSLLQQGLGNEDLVLSWHS